MQTNSGWHKISHKANTECSDKVRPRLLFSTILLLIRIMQRCLCNILICAHVTWSDFSWSLTKWRVSLVSEYVRIQYFRKKKYITLNKRWKKNSYVPGKNNWLNSRIVCPRQITFYANMAERRNCTEINTYCRWVTATKP